MDINLMIMRFLSPDDDHTTIPGTEPKIGFGYIENGKHVHRATTYNNDGHELWLSFANKWIVYYEARDARRLAWFILWDWWIVSTWCGLKRRIYYWALSSHVRSFNPN